MSQPPARRVVSFGQTAVESVVRQVIRLAAAGLATWLTGQAAQRFGEGSPVFSSDNVEFLLFSLYTVAIAPLMRKFWPTLTDRTNVGREDLPPASRNVV